VVNGCADTSLTTSTCDDAYRNLQIIYKNALINFRGCKISNKVCVQSQIVRGKNLEGSVANLKVPLLPALNWTQENHQRKKEIKGERKE
jgi:flavoprotein